jgi:hypothetical protein
MYDLEFKCHDYENAHPRLLASIQIYISYLPVLLQINKSINHSESPFITQITFTSILESSPEHLHKMATKDNKAAIVSVSHHATVDQLTDTLIPTWTLDYPHDDHVPSAEAMLFTNGLDENVLSAKDGRTRVSDEKFAPGGIYRCM